MSGIDRVCSGKSVEVSNQQKIEDLELSIKDIEDIISSSLGDINTELTDLGDYIDFLGEKKKKLKELNK